jgi:hypothetical protein
VRWRTLSQIPITRESISLIYKVTPPILKKQGFSRYFLRISLLILHRPILPNIPEAIPQVQQFDTCGSKKG